MRAWMSGRCGHKKFRSSDISLWFKQFLKTLPPLHTTSIMVNHWSCHKSLTHLCVPLGDIVSRFLHGYWPGTWRNNSRSRRTCFQSWRLTCDSWFVMRLLWGFQPFQVTRSTWMFQLKLMHQLKGMIKIPIKKSHLHGILVGIQRWEVSSKNISRRQRLLRGNLSSTCPSPIALATSRCRVEVLGWWWYWWINSNCRCAISCVPDAHGLSSKAHTLFSTFAVTHGRPRMTSSLSNAQLEVINHEWMIRCKVDCIPWDARLSSVQV